MRITTGIAKNKKLIAPNIEGYRAVQDKFKLAMFSIIGDRVINSEFLDLYAGSGSVGLEALSRGAKHCDFVDNNYEAIKVIKLNIKNTGFEGKAKTYKDSVVKYVGNTDKTYDLIFLDPFYDDVKLKFIFENLEEILNKDGLICLSHGENLNVPDQIANTNLKIITHRRFGKSNLTILSH